MSNIDRDPILCQERIEKRRQLLIQLHQENLIELENPALVEIEEENYGTCQEANCLLKENVIDKKEYNFKQKIKWAWIIVSITIIICLFLLAFYIGRLGA
ncbi:hypothetical protein [Mycoplasmopsis columbina]|uniref:hypothetical protein n=1 Tax=Mycoplasmopsis columbina TaxID=114881 RepID=UPI0004A744C8|nr:hypothetical protein [Mycoplasmopsis columbina]VEU76953.1 Uncharacterised protein [Mycoplasmopsis columbina]